eukprot:349656-Chlamydomonas_euryale.AAC.3
MDALWPLSNETLFLVEGCGQGGINGANWCECSQLARTEGRGLRAMLAGYRSSGKLSEGALESGLEEQQQR